MAVSNSSSVVLWNSSSRGSVSRMCMSALPSWLDGGSSERRITSATFSRNTGISRGLVA